MIRHKLVVASGCESAPPHSEWATTPEAEGNIPRAKDNETAIARARRADVPLPQPPFRHSRALRISCKTVGSVAVWGYVQGAAALVSERTAKLPRRRTGLNLGGGFGAEDPHETLRSLTLFVCFVPRQGVNRARPIGDVDHMRTTSIPNNHGTFTNHLHIRRQSSYVPQHITALSPTESSATCCCFAASRR